MSDTDWNGMFSASRLDAPVTQFEDQPENYTLFDKSTAIRWVWQAMPRLPHNVVWKSITKVSSRDVIRILWPFTITVQRQVLGLQPPPSDCDILLTWLGETRYVEKCQMDLRFFVLDEKSKTRKCYHVGPLREQSWHEANEYCMSMGANLNTIDSAHDIPLLYHALDGAITGNISAYDFIVHLGIYRKVSTIIFI